MKFTVPKKAVVVLALTGLTIFVLIPEYREGLVRPKNVYVGMGLRELATIIHELHAKDSKFPDEVRIRQSTWRMEAKPDEHGPLVIADPYNQVEFEGEERRHVEVVVDGLNGRWEDFSFSGNNLRYRLLSDECALIYSYGPDEDDDFERIVANKSIQALALSESLAIDQHPDFVQCRYDPSNGTISGGDIGRIVYPGQ